MFDQKMTPYFWVNKYVHIKIHKKSFEKNAHKGINSSFVWMLTEVL